MLIKNALAFSKMPWILNPVLMFSGTYNAQGKKAGFPNSPPDFFKHHAISRDHDFI
jgi:hypothetical protein